MTGVSPRVEAPQHVAVLDGLRGLLTVLVLEHHVVGAALYRLTPSPDDGAWWKWWVVFAQGTAIGLPIYFVISGFVIFLPAARNGGNMGSLGWYAARRFVRIAPAYYLSIVLLVLVWPFFFSDVPSPMASRRGVEIVLGHVTFLQTVLFDRTDIGFGLNGSLWTLTLEEFFYATLPVFALVLFRRPWRVLSGAFILTLGWRVGSMYLPEVAAFVGAPEPDAGLPSHLFHQFPGYAFQFAVGSVTAWIYVHHYARFSSGRWHRTCLVLHGIGLVAIALAMLRSGLIGRTFRDIVPDITHDVFPAVVFAVMILAIVFGPPAAHRLYANRFCRFLGDTSYGVYLWHMPLIQLVYRYGGLPAQASARSVLIYTVWVLPGSLLLGWLSFRFVEHPLSQALRRYRSALGAARPRPALDRAA